MDPRGDDQKAGPGNREPTSAAWPWLESLPFRAAEDVKVNKTDHSERMWLTRYPQIV